MDRVLAILIKLIVFFSGFMEPLSKSGLCHFSKWEPGQKIKLLLVGYNGARNTGADARVVAITRQIKEVFGADQVQITVMTLSRQNLSGYFDDDIELLEFSSIFLLDLLRACSSHHAAILCEGSTLKSTFANALTLFFCEASGIMHRQGKPCIAYGSEVGEMEPFLRKISMELCKDTYFITRTEDSQKALDALCLNGHVGTDTAWKYDKAIGAEKARELLIAQGWDGKKPLLGIAVIDPFCWPVRASMTKWIKGLLTRNMNGQYDKWYFFSQSKERTKAYHRYINAIADAVLRYQRKKDVFPVFIGMERLDAKAVEDLKKRLSVKAKQAKLITEDTKDLPGATFLSGDCSADIMAGILCRLSMLITSRYHAAVLSMEGSLPIIAVSMDERLDGILKELRLDRNYLHHVTAPHLGKQILASMYTAELEKTQIEHRIQEERHNYQKKTDQMGAFLKEYILEGLS